MKINREENRRRMRSDRMGHLKNRKNGIEYSHRGYVWARSTLDICCHVWTLNDLEMETPKAIPIFCRSALCANCGFFNLTDSSSVVAYVTGLCLLLLFTMQRLLMEIFRNINSFNSFRNNSEMRCYCCCWWWWEKIEYSNSCPSINAWSSE